MVFILGTASCIHRTCPTQRALDGEESPRFRACLRGLKLVPAKHRSLVPPISG